MQKDKKTKKYKGRQKDKKYQKKQKDKKSPKWSSLNHYALNAKRILKKKEKKKIEKKKDLTRVRLVKPLQCHLDVSAKTKTWRRKISHTNYPQKTVRSHLRNHIHPLKFLQLLKKKANFLLISWAPNKFLCDLNVHIV